MDIPNRTDDTSFFTCVCTPEQAGRASLMISSLRAFGGELAHCPFWIAVPDDSEIEGHIPGENVEFVTFRVPDSLGTYYFSRKVCAAAAVEERVPASCRSLVWIIPEALVARPPLQFRLADPEAMAVRPVHITNVGLPSGREPDAFWGGVYRVVGEPNPAFVVESFIERERIRPYFNSAAYSIDPSLGLLRRWRQLFEILVGDSDYQKAACWDELHRIFLHQAVLSTLMAVSVPSEDIRLLPPDYGYPYNLHGRLPADRRAQKLGDLSCIIYEERSVDPRIAHDVAFGEPLGSWLVQGLSNRDGGRDDQ